MTNEEALEVYRQKIKTLQITETAQSRKINELLKRDKQWRAMLQQLYQIAGIQLPKIEKEEL